MKKTKKLKIRKKTLIRDNIEKNTIMEKIRLWIKNTG